MDGLFLFKVRIDSFENDENNHFQKNCDVPLCYNLFSSSLCMCVCYSKKKKNIYIYIYVRTRICDPNPLRTIKVGPISLKQYIC